MIDWKLFHHKMKFTGIGCLLLGYQNRPENQSHDKWEYERGSIEDAEEGPVLCCGVCARRRQEFLETCCV